MRIGLEVFSPFGYSMTHTTSTESPFFSWVSNLSGVWNTEAKLILYLCLGEVGDVSKSQEIIHGSFRTVQRIQGDEMKAGGFQRQRFKQLILLSAATEGKWNYFGNFLDSLSCAE